MSVAFLFPGQGSQYAGMLHDLPYEQSVIRQTIEEASTALNADILAFDSPEKLESTVAVQLCLLTAGVAIGRLLQNKNARPSMVAGHSVGAFSAAVMANVLSFQDALHLVKQRGELMEQSYPKGYGMGVIIGIREKTLISLVESIHTPAHPVYIANLNSPTQITIAGENSALEKVFDASRKTGARKAHKLQVSVPSHCLLLKNVSAELSRLLKQVNFQKPTIPYAGNRTARPLRTAQAIQEDLALSISHPVRWHDATSVLFELGARLYVEIMPGQVLTNLARDAFPEARSVSVSANGWKNVIQIIERVKNEK